MKNRYYGSDSEKITNYFEEFEQSESAVLENLTQKVLGKVKKENQIPDSIKAFIKDFNELKELESNRA